MKLALTLAVAAVFAVAGVAKIVALPAMRTSAEQQGLSVGVYRLVGLLELAGVAGVLLGQMYVALGVLAGLGLICLMIGAIVVLVRIGARQQALIPLVTIGVLAVQLLW